MMLYSRTDKADKIFMPNVCFQNKELISQEGRQQITIIESKSIRRRRL